MYAVIFTSVRNANDDGYAEMAERMVELARQQPGFVDVESARDKTGITVSYWESLEAIAAWKRNTEHLFAQQKGRSDWYSHYKVRIAKIEREYSFGIGLG